MFITIGARVEHILCGNSYRRELLIAELISLFV